MAQPVKNTPVGQEADPSSIPGSGRCLGEGNGNPVQYSCLGNPVDRGLWQATVYGVVRVGYNLETKLPLPHNVWVKLKFTKTLAI